MLNTRARESREATADFQSALVDEQKRREELEKKLAEYKGRLQRQSTEVEVLQGEMKKMSTAAVGKDALLLEQRQMIMDLCEQAEHPVAGPSKGRK